MISSRVEREPETLVDNSWLAKLKAEKTHLRLFAGSSIVKNFLLTANTIIVKSGEYDTTTYNIDEDKLNEWVRIIHAHRELEGFDCYFLLQFVADHKDKPEFWQALQDNDERVVLKHIDHYRNENIIAWIVYQLKECAQIHVPIEQMDSADQAGLLNGARIVLRRILATEAKFYRECYAQLPALSTAKVMSRMAQSDVVTRPVEDKSWGSRSSISGSTQQPSVIKIYEDYFAKPRNNEVYSIFTRPVQVHADRDQRSLQAQFLAAHPDSFGVKPRQ